MQLQTLSDHLVDNSLWFPWFFVHAACQICAGPCIRLCLTDVSITIRPKSQLYRYQYEAAAILHPVFMSDDSMRPDMTWAAAIPKDAQENADSLQPNPNGFMELNDLPLMLDVVSMLEVDDDQTSRLEQWLRCASVLCSQLFPGPRRKQCS